jgi:hypothetical protein
VRVCTKDMGVIDITIIGAIAAIVAATAVARIHIGCYKKDYSSQATHMQQFWYK